MAIAVIALISGVLLGAFILIPLHDNLAHMNKGQSNTNNSKASKSYSETKVALHNKRTDCWIIIKDKVYDVTSHVEEHTC
ncbi:hypothetical protein REPUB_Repub10bG0031100 [Reevesia pubescens]